METIDAVTKTLASAGGVFVIYKYVHDGMFSRWTRKRAQYERELKLFKELKENPDIPPHLRALAYQQAVEKDIAVEVIIYLQSLEFPVGPLSRWHNEYHDLAMQGDQLKVIFRDPYQDPEVRRKKRRLLVAQFWLPLPVMLITGAGFWPSVALLARIGLGKTLAVVTAAFFFSGAWLGWGRNLIALIRCQDAELLVAKQRPYKDSPASAQTRIESIELPLQGNEKSGNVVLMRRDGSEQAPPDD